MLLRRIVACVAVSLVLPAGVALAQPAPASDVVETFAADPRPGASWAFTGAFGWAAASGAVSTPKAGAASAQWLPGWYYAGTLVTRLMLVASPVGTRPNATVVFAADPATGASRWVKITAGAPGTVVLGQTGTIGGTGPRTIRRARTPVPVKTWLDLSLTIARDGAVTVKLGATPLFTAAAGPLAPGRVGFGTTKTRVSFTSFAFRDDPDAEPCETCHAGQPEAAPAPDVYRFWDGSWWDGNQSGSDIVQQGGHGDPDGRPANTCTGTTGCHDMRLPKPGDHRNGVLEPVTGATKNTYHLRAGFIDTTPATAGDVQLTFDNYCYTACHKAAGVLNHRHTDDAGPKYVQFGEHLSDPSAGAVPADYVLDQGLSTAASLGIPVFAPCVACHDPHGTRVSDTRNGSNKMMRDNYFSTATACAYCHN